MKLVYPKLEDPFEYLTIEGDIIPECLTLQSTRIYIDNFIDWNPILGIENILIGVLMEFFFIFNKRQNLKLLKKGKTVFFSLIK